MSTDTSTLKIGTQIDGKHSYTIKRLIERGGFGVTYEATATYMDGNIRQTMRYCVKEFFPQGICRRQPDGIVTAIEGCEDDFKSMKKHFVTEAELMRDVCHHWGMVSINEVFDYMGTSYYIMEYIDGESLESHIKNHGPMSEAEALDLANKLGEALTFLHSKFINHLDVKPDNVMLTHEDRGQLQPILIDFSLSRRFRKNGTVASMANNSGVTEGYSPVEQYAGIDKFSPSADVYALAATLLFTLTGKHPCSASEMDAEWLKINLPANLSTETEYALVQALKPCNERCQTVEAFMRMLPLDTLRAQTAVHVNPELSPKTRPLKPQGTDQRHTNRPSHKRTVLLIVIGLLVCLLITLGIIALQNNKDTIEIQEKQSEQYVAEDQDTADAPAPKTEEIIENEDATTDDVNNEPEPEVSAGSAQPKETNAKAEQQKAEPDEKGGSRSQAEGNTGTLHLGYATYEGKISKGVAHGRGKLTFHIDHVIDTYDPQQRMATAGDVVTGMFYDGHLTQGKITHKDGSTETIIIGG